MAEHDPIWPRPHFQETQARVEFDLYCFSIEEIDLQAGSPAGEPWCPSGQIAAEVDLGVYNRDSAGNLFDSILGKMMGRASLKDPEQAATLFSRFQHLNCVEVKTRDSANLSYLQDAWAMVRWLVRNGAAAVYDDAARRWHLAEEVESWPTPLPQDWGREVGTVLEVDGERMMHSRGMKKFGRPDLLFKLGPGCTDGDIKEVGEVLDSVQEAFVHGRVLTPGQPVTLLERAYSTERYEPGRNAPDVCLENEGLLLKRAPAKRFWSSMFGRPSA